MRVSIQCRSISYAILVFLHDLIDNLLRRGPIPVFDGIVKALPNGIAG
jgi:hypothetical protein